MKHLSILLLMLLMNVFPASAVWDVIQDWGADTPWPMKYKAGGPVSTNWYKTAYDNVDNSFTNGFGPIQSDDEPYASGLVNCYTYPLNDFAETYFFTYFIGDAGKTYYMEVSVDDVADIYFNGNKVQLNDDAGYYPLVNAKGGKNTIAVKYDNSGGGSGYFDYAISVEVPDSWYRNDGSWPMKSLLTTPQKDANGKEWYQEGYNDNSWSNVTAPLYEDYLAENGSCYLRGYANINQSTMPQSQFVEMSLDVDNKATIYLNGEYIGVIEYMGASLAILRDRFKQGQNLLAIHWEDFGALRHLQNLSFTDFNHSQNYINFVYQGLSFHGYNIGNGIYDLSVTGYHGSSSSVVIPDYVYGNSVTSISDGAFKDTGITSITIPNSITSIGSNVFDGCQLNSITLNAGNTVYQSVGNGKGLVEIANPNNLLYAATRLTLPSNITDIAPYAFGGTKEVIINDTIPPTWEGEGCYISKDLIIYVPSAQFYDYVDAWPWAFGNLTRIGANIVKNVIVDAQPNTSDLHDKVGEDNLEFVTNLTLHGTINSYDIMIIRNKMVRLRYLDLSDVSIVYNPYEYYTGYCSQDDILTTNAFCELERLETIKLPRTITTIEPFAFANSPNLREVVLYEGLETISGDAFLQCDGLEEITIPYSVNYIGPSAFSSLPNLRTVTFEGKPDRAEARTEELTIDNNAFYGCSRLETVIINGENTVIGISAFQDCGNLTTVTMCEGVPSIESYAFAGCSSLQQIEIPYSVTSIKEGAFASSGLQRVRLSAKMDDQEAEELSKLVRIEAYAFSGCDLADIFMPDQLLSIGESAFEGNGRLTTVYLPSSLQSTGENAFANCSNIKEYYVKCPVPHQVEMHTFSNYQTSILYVPNKPERTRNAYYWDTEWSKFLRLRTYDANYRGSRINFGDDRTVDFSLVDGDRIPGTPDIFIYPYSGYVIIGEDYQPIGELHLLGDGIDGASIIDQGNITVDSLFFDIKIDPERWYFLTFPFNVNLSDITAPGRYVFRYYDGNERASNGSGGWKNLPVDAECLEAGKGYIFNCESIDEGEEDEWGNIIGKLTCKVENPVFNGQQKNLSIKTYISDSNQDASWNLLGNPYPSYYDINAMGYESPITIWNGEGYDSYRPGDDEYFLHPFEAFFVQKPEDVASMQFPLEGRLTYLQIQASQSQAPKRKVDTAVTRQFINLTLTDGEHSDRTRVVFNEKKTIGYDLGDDAAKFMANAIPQLYTLDELGNHFSINERPAGNVMLGVKAPQQGTYTISAKRMDCPVLLLDKVNGQYIDLTMEDYQFECHAGKVEDRFVLVYDTHADSIAQLYDATGVSIMPTEGGIGIQGAGQATVEIYNAGGALVGTPAGDGLTPLAKGVYFVKVNNHSAKVVVK